MVLGMILIVTILATVILSIILNQSRITHHQVSRIQAYYAAQAGMNLALERLRTGAWGTDSYYFCNSPARCTAAPFSFPNCDVTDADIPYCTNITVADLGSSIDNVGREIRITTNYTPLT